MIFTRREFDQSGCSTPDCGHDHSQLFLHAACHPKAGVEVLYTKASGTMRLSCAKCHKPIVEVAVAATPEDILNGPSLH